MPELNVVWREVLKADFIKKQCLMPSVVKAVNLLSSHFTEHFSDEENADMVASFYPTVYPSIEKFLEHLDVNKFLEAAPAPNTVGGYIYHKFWIHFLAHGRRRFAESFLAVDGCVEIYAALHILERHIDLVAMDKLPMWDVKR